METCDSLKMFDDSLREIFEADDRPVRADNRYIIFYIDGREVYHISAADLRTKAQLTKWIAHLMPKRWVTKAHISRLMSYSARVGNFDLHDPSVRGEPNKPERKSQ